MYAHLLVNPNDEGPSKYFSNHFSLTYISQGDLTYVINTIVVNEIGHRFNKIISLVNLTMAIVIQL